MSEQNSSQEKTEQPTEKRLKKARKDGQVARSKELNTAGTLNAGDGAGDLTNGHAPFASRQRQGAQGRRTREHR